MGSFEINSTSKSAGTNKTQYKDLSLFIYNRNTHDKSMSVNMAEIDFMIGLGTILYKDEDKETLYQLINGGYSSLFDKGFINEIKELKLEDYQRICNYSLGNNGEYSFWGMEYHILRHLIDYHLKVFERDIRNGRLDRMIKLSVSKDNLIVKVFPTKSTENNPVSYCVSLLYLVLLHLYKHINRHVYENIYKYNIHNFPEERYIVWIMKSVFTYILPIVTKVKYQITTNADDNYTWFNQLKQLKSGYEFFQIEAVENYVRFLFRPKEEYLASTLNFPVRNSTPSETNYEKRFIECVYTLNKDNSLTCDTTIISKDMVDCVFATQIDEYDEPVSIYSSLSDDECIYLAEYSIFERLLSFTVQHEKLKAKMSIKARNHVEQGGFNVITEATNNEKAKWLTKANTFKHSFKDIELPLPDDKLISIITKELNELGQKNSLVDYTIIVLELFKKDNKVIKETLAPLDERTSDKIIQVIRKLQKLDFVSGYSLNEFYKEYQSA